MVGGEAGAKNPIDLIEWFPEPMAKSASSKNPGGG